MLIENPEVKTILEDYDILYSSGLVNLFTIDTSKGDTYFDDGYTIRVHLAPKSLPSGGDNKTSGEDHTIKWKHIASIKKVTREVIEPSVEEKAELAQTWKAITSMPKGVM